MIARIFDLITTPQAAVLSPRTPRRLVLAVLATLVFTTGALSLMSGLLNRPLWLRAVVAAASISTLAAALSLIPMIWGLRRSLSAAAAGYFVAMGVRAVVSVGGILLTVHAGGYPQTPSLLMMAIFYVCVMSVEVLVVGSAAWVVEQPAAR